MQRLKGESMKSKWIKILVWLGVMSVLTAVAMFTWRVACDGSKETASLKWLQLLQTFGTFLLPPIICAWLWDDDHKPFTWLGITRGANWKVFGLAVVIMICAVPGINLLADLNSRVVLPKSLEFIEEFLRAQEDAAAVLTEQFLKTDSVWGLLINIGLLALLPAMAEELSFRGTLQQIISDGQRVNAQYTKVHVAIWVTAIVFSAIHMQFYGFVPRMLMGALFGYVFVWTGSLWVPIVMHFTNNGLAVLCYYLFDEIGENEKSWADTIGAGSTWWLGVISLIVVCGLVWLIRVQGQREYVRRTHIQ